MLRTCLLALLFLPLIAAAREPVSNAKAKQFAKKHSLFFIENKGQVQDQYGNGRNDIDFKVAATNGLNIFIGKGGLHYQWSREASPRPSPKEREVLCEKNEANCKGSGDFSPEKNRVRNDGPDAKVGEVSTYRMDVELVGANRDAELVVEEAQQYYENYFLSGLGQKVTRVNTYKKIVYKNVYPNIDWVLYVGSRPNPSQNFRRFLTLQKGFVRNDGSFQHDDGLEYDFVVHLGGKVSDIKLKYSGATDKQLNADGSLTATTPMGAINEKSPSSYEKESGAKVNSSFVLKDEIIAFNTDSYTGTLVIDPTLDWCTYFGGSSDDWGEGLACDGWGNVFMGGYTNSSGNIATAGSYLSTYTAGIYTFLAKFDPFGSIDWATYYYGDSYGSSWWGGNRVACDPSGNVYLTGEVHAMISGLATTNAYQTSYAGGWDVYLAKFDGSGNVLWATYYGGNLDDVSIGVACDASGNVFLRGGTESSSGIATTGAYQTSVIGLWNSFVVKFNSSGSRQWGTYYGGSCSFTSWYGTGMACDGSGNVFISGNTCATSNIATVSAYQTSLAGGYDAYLAKFNSNGAMQWATYYGGTSDEWGGGLVCNSNGDVYMTGYTESTSGIATPGAYQTNNGGVVDAILVKFSGSGSRLWATYYGGAGNDYGNNVVCNSAGSVFVVGYTKSTSGIATANAYQISLSGLEEGFVAEFDASGSMQYATYYGGPYNDRISGVACDPYNNIFMCGLTSSTSAIATTGAYQSTFGGGTYDAFLGKWEPDSFFVMGHTFNTVYCAGDTLHLSFQVGLGFQSGNVFKAQLSDAYGSFANALTIGTDTAILSGSIACAIPANTIAGNHYHFRIISTNPVDSSFSDTTNIQIKPKPYFTVSSNTPICEGKVLQFSSSNTYTPVTYHWTGPNGFVSLSANPLRNNVSMANSGYYYVTDTFNGCTATDTIEIGILQGPASASANSNMPCIGDTLKLSANSSSSGINYHWTGPNSFSSFQQNPFITNASSSMSGSYHAIFSLSNGCADTLNVPVTVSAITGPPIVSISASPDTICAGGNVTLSAVVSNAGSPAYLWRRNGVVLGGASSAVFTTGNVANGDHIVCRVTSNAPCQPIDTALSNTVSLHVILIPPPSVTVSCYPVNYVIGDTVSFTGHLPMNTNGFNYQWRKNGVDIPGATLSVYTTSNANVGDIFCLFVHSSVPCTIPDTAIACIGLTEGVGSWQSAIGSWQVYPNPNNGSLTLSLSEGEGTVRDGIVSIYITNTIGQVVYKGLAETLNGKLNQQIYLKVPSGVYLLRVRTDGGNSVLRFVVE